MEAIEKIRMSPGTLMKPHVVAVTAIRLLCQLTVSAGCETHSCTAYVGKELAPSVRSLMLNKSKYKKS